MKRGNVTRIVRGKVLATSLNSMGYPCVNLNREHKLKRMLIHRLVAQAFIPKVDGKDSVDHIDANRLNCHVNNLRWCTLKENSRFAVEMGHYRVPIPTKEQREARSRRMSKPVIRDDGVEYPSVKSAAKDLGVTAACVSHVLHGRNQTVKGHTFTYR